MPYFANLRLIVELSTPLVNMRWYLYALGYKKDSIIFFVNGIVMTVTFFLVRVAFIPVYWYKVYIVIDSPLWMKMRNFRYIMVITCIILDVINVYWFQKMFKGALIMWSTNWQYYEKYHKPQQLEMISAYRKNFMDKIFFANNILLQSTLNGLHIINPSRFMPSSSDILTWLDYGITQVQETLTPRILIQPQAQFSQNQQLKQPPLQQNKNTNHECTHHHHHIKTRSQMKL
jgi:hypothetical protein